MAFTVYMGVVNTVAQYEFVQNVRNIQYFTFSGNYCLPVLWPTLFYFLCKYGNECKWISITTLNVTSITYTAEVLVTAMFILLLGNWNTSTVRVVL